MISGSAVLIVLSVCCMQFFYRFDVQTAQVSRRRVTELFLIIVETRDETLQSGAVL